MQCKLYENVYCILTDTINKPNDYCCYNCLIHTAVKHDEELGKELDLNNE